MLAKVVLNAKISMQPIVNYAFHVSPKKKPAMNEERKCVQKLVEFARSRLLLKRCLIVLTLHTAVVGTLHLPRDQTDRDAEFARTCIAGCAVCGTITANQKHTGLSRKMLLTDTDIAVQSRAANVDQVKRCWTLRCTGDFKIKLRQRMINDAPRKMPIYLYLRGNH